jgi:hypothetical protein
MAMKYDFTNIIFGHPLIVLFILISGIFSMSCLYTLYMDPGLLSVAIPTILYSNVEANKAKILKENKGWNEQRKKII